MTSTDPPPLAVRSTADLISAVPYLLGFHPADSLVVLAMRGTRVTFVARGDLPDPGDPDAVRQATEYVAAMVTRQGAEAVTIIGYGPARRVTPVVDAMEMVCGRGGLFVFDTLRVDDGRYWSYRCEHPGCCPPDGTPFDPAATEVAAAATFAGHVALPDRSALTAQVAPVDGPAREAMRAATERALVRLAALTGPAGTTGPGSAPPDAAGSPATGSVDAAAVFAAGAAAVRLAEDRHRAQGQLTDDELAWLAVLLTHLPVRDHAWERIGPEEWQLALWTDVLRRAEPAQVPAPGSLLAFAAWRFGHGALAMVAVERALAADPEYTMAHLMADVLAGGVPPSTLDDWPNLGRPPRPGGPGAGPGRDGRSGGPGRGRSDPGRASNRAPARYPGRRARSVRVRNRRRDWR